MDEDKKKELKELKRKCRHKAETPLFILSIFLSLAALISISYFGIVVIDDPENYAALMEELEISENLADVLIDAGRFLSIAILILIVGRTLLALFRDYGRALSWDLPINEKQFAEFYNTVQEYSKRLEIDKNLPVVSSVENRYVEFYGLELFSPYVIKIDADTITETLDRGDFSNVNYLIAVDLAAEFLGYKNPFRYMITCAVNWIPIYNSVCSRTMTYSVDRVAQFLLGDEVAAKALITRVNYNWLISSIDLDAYVENINRPLTRMQRIARFFENLLSDVPIPAYRIAAMLDPEKKDGRLF